MFMCFSFIFLKDHIPTKQGLRHDSCGSFHCFNTALKDHIPTKQGLFRIENSKLKIENDYSSPHTTKTSMKKCPVDFLKHLKSPQRGRQITDRGVNPCTNGSKKAEPRRGDTQHVADYLSPLQGFALSSTSTGAFAPVYYLPVLRTL